MLCHALPVVEHAFVTTLKEWKPTRFAPGVVALDLEHEPLWTELEPADRVLLQLAYAGRQRLSAALRERESPLLHVGTVAHLYTELQLFLALLYSVCAQERPDASMDDWERFERDMAEYVPWMKRDEGSGALQWIELVKRLVGLLGDHMDAKLLLDSLVHSTKRARSDVA